MSKKLTVWILCVAIPLTILSTIGQNTFVPSPIWTKLGAILILVPTAVICFIARRKILEEDDSAGLTVFAMLVLATMLAWRMSQFLILSVPDVYTRHFGHSATLQVHPTRIIGPRIDGPNRGRTNPLQAEIREKPAILGNIYLYDAPLSIKRVYGVIRGPLEYGPPITLAGRQSFFGFHKDGFVTEVDAPW